MFRPKSKRRRVFTNSNEKNKKINSTLEELTDEQYLSSTSKNNNKNENENENEENTSKKQFISRSTRKRLLKKQNNKHSLLSKLSENSKQKKSNSKIENDEELKEKEKKSGLFLDFSSVDNFINEQITKQKNEKSRFKKMTSQQKTKQQINDIKNLKNIFSLPSFQANPSQTIQTHLINKFKLEQHINPIFPKQKSQKESMMMKMMMNENNNDDDENDDENDNEDNENEQNIKKNVNFKALFSYRDKLQSIKKVNNAKKWGKSVFINKSIPGRFSNSKRRRGGNHFQKRNRSFNNNNNNEISGRKRKRD